MKSNKNVASPKKSKLTMQQREGLLGYMFISPLIFGFMAFFLRPIVESLRMAFSKVIIVPNQGEFILESIGFENFTYAFQIDPNFNRLLTEEFQQMLTDVPGILVFSFFVALILNQEFVGRGVARAIFFLPVILSSGVILQMELENVLLQEMSGATQESGSYITNLFRTLFLSNPETSGYIQVVFTMVDSIYSIALSSGIQIVIMMIGLQNIPVSFIEAAYIEGCSKWESFWKITLPMVSPLIIVNIIYTIISFFTRSDNEVMTQITTAMMSQLNYGLSSAMAWSYFGIIIVVLTLFVGIISRWVYKND